MATRSEPPGAARDPASFSIGIDLRAIRAEPVWWLESARRLDEAGYAGLWCWDHFMGRGDPTVPVVESGRSCDGRGADGRVTVGPFVANVMNRHPALVARMAATLQIASGGRLSGDRDRWCAARARGLRDGLSRRGGARGPARGGDRCSSGAVDGRPVTRIAVYPLVDAYAYPSGPAPAIVIGGETRPARVWPAGSGTAGPRSTSTSRRSCRSISSRSKAAGQRREDQLVLVGFHGTGLGTTSEGLRPMARCSAGEVGAPSASPGPTAIVLTPQRSRRDGPLEAAGRW